MKIKRSGKVILWQIGSILRAVYTHPGITRAELSETLQINKSLITQLITFLEERGWLICRGEKTKNIPISLNPSRLNIAGVEIQPEYCRLTIYDLAGRPLFERTWTERFPDLQVFLQVVLPYQLLSSGLPIGAVGVALPGIVDTAQNRLVQSKPLGIDTPVQLPSRIGDASYPVFYDNDARCNGWNFVCFDKEAENFALFYLSLVECEPPASTYARVIQGASLFLDGKAYRGSHDCLGEINALRLPKLLGNGEGYIDYDALLRMKTDPALLDALLDSLAAHVGYLASFLDVKKVYLCGSLPRYKERLQDVFTSVSGALRQYPDLQNCTLVFPDDGQALIVRGAAGMAIDRLFSIPQTEAPSEFYSTIARS